jgi:hypothetical protein
MTVEPAPQFGCVRLRAAVEIDREDVQHQRVRHAQIVHAQSVIGPDGAAQRGCDRLVTCGNGKSTYSIEKIPDLRAGIYPASWVVSKA